MNAPTLFRSTTTNSIKRKRSAQNKQSVSRLICDAEMDRKNFEDGLGDIYKYSFERKLKKILSHSDIFESEKNLRDAVENLKNSGHVRCEA